MAPKPADLANWALKPMDPTRSVPADAACDNKFLLHLESKCHPKDLLNQSTHESIFPAKNRLCGTVEIYVNRM